MQLPRRSMVASFTNKIARPSWMIGRFESKPVTSRGKSRALMRLSKQPFARSKINSRSAGYRSRLSDGATVPVARPACRWWCDRRCSIGGLHCSHPMGSQRNITSENWPSLLASDGISARFDVRDLRPSRRDKRDKRQPLAKGGLMSRFRCVAPGRNIHSPFGSNSRSANCGDVAVDVRSRLR